MLWGSSPAAVATRFTGVAQNYVADGPAERAERAREHLLGVLVVLAAGAVAEQGPALRVLEAPEHEATRELLQLPVESEVEAKRRQ